MSFSKLMKKGGPEAKRIYEILLSFPGFKQVDPKQLCGRIYQKIHLESLFSGKQLKEMNVDMKLRLKKINKHLTVTWWLDGQFPTRKILYSTIGLSDNHNVDDDDQEWKPLHFCLKKKEFEPTESEDEFFEQQRTWLEKFLWSYKEGNPFDDNQESPSIIKRKRRHSSSQETASKKAHRSKRRVGNGGHVESDHYRHYQANDGQLVDTQSIESAVDKDDGNNTELRRKSSRRKSSAKKFDLRVKSHPSDQLNEDDSEHEQQNGIEPCASSLQEEKKFTCRVCKKTFKKSCHLQTHVNSVHLNIRYECQLCDKSFSQRGHLKLHRQSVHENVRHSCDFCDKSFTCPSYLKLHVESDHQGIRFPCELCGKGFIQRSHLNTHMDIKHYDVRYPCDLCDKSFSLRWYLNVHKDSVHAKIKHPCKLCDKSFSQANYLKVHVNNVHNNVRHLCQLCGKSFTFKHSLKFHVESVHEKIRHKCKLCDKDFSQPKSLKKHVIKVHSSDLS